MASDQCRPVFKEEMLKSIHSKQAYDIMVESMFDDNIINSGRLYILEQFTIALEKYHRSNVFRHCFENKMRELQNKRRKIQDQCCQEI